MRVAPVTLAGVLAAAACAHSPPTPPPDPTLCYAVRYQVSGVPLVESVSSAPACVSRPATAPPPAPSPTPTGGTP